MELMIRKSVAAKLTSDKTILNSHKAKQIPIHAGMMNLAHGEGEAQGAWMFYGRLPKNENWPEAKKSGDFPLFSDAH